MSKYLYTDEQPAQPARPRPKSPYLAGDDVLVYFDARYYPAEVHSVEREAVAGRVVGVYAGFRGRAEAIRFDAVDVHPAGVPF